MFSNRFIAVKYTIFIPEIRLPTMPHFLTKTNLVSLNPIIVVHASDINILSYFQEKTPRFQPKIHDLLQHLLNLNEYR